ncbi:hypothetical protein KGM_214803 [Danaus plexippus plexippus]|uniref:Uncharacterized protein n=1 Tax=Danaus plexippus plexippus TaxID=278856 RepID=A0A212F155_DANPL|nr:hypothetical protein KGM_214803 [Danaus plexippus plexippus]
MPSSRIPSPARSQGVISTPRRPLRRTRSVDSPARTNLRLTSIISESIKLSPLPSRQSVLNDDTDIDIPGRRSWWKKIDDNSRDVQELLESKDLVEVNNLADEFDVEVLSQEKKNYSLDLAESSDGESINSIIIPQRKIFKPVDNEPKQKFGNIMSSRVPSNKHDRSLVEQNNEISKGFKNLFNQSSKPRTKPVFPSALLNVSANKTINKTKELPPAEIKGQVRSLFGARPGAKRRNMFADFIVSESEDEIPEIQPRVFGFQKKNEQKRRASSMSRHSPTSSIDLEIDDWRLLPSSTLVENILEESPVKRAKLNVSESKEIENINSNTPKRTVTPKTSANPKQNITKNVSENNSFDDDEVNEINIKPQNSYSNNSRVTRSQSLKENSVSAPRTPDIINKSKQQQLNKNSVTSKPVETVANTRDSEQGQNNLEEMDEDFTLKYDNDEEISKKSPENKNPNTLKLDEVDNIAVSEKNKKSTEIHGIQQKSNNETLLSHNDIMVNEISEVSNLGTHEKSLVKNKSALIQDELIPNKNGSSVLDKEKERDRNKSIHNSSRNRSTAVSDSKTSQRISNVAVDKSISLNETNTQEKENNTVGEEESAGVHSEVNANMKERDKDATLVEENNDQNIPDIPIEDNNASQAHKEDGNAKDINESKKKQTSNRKRSTKNVSSSSPNVSHDTTGIHRKREETQVKSPEVILHDKTRDIDSFTVQGRNTSARKTKSIIFKNKSITHSLAPLRESIGFSDGTRDSSAEGSGWDSHRTTRKTLRQTFGKDFTPRKSLRALVMEKTAKLQAANFNEAGERKKSPQARSTAYGEVQGEFHSYQEPEPLQVEESVESVQSVEKHLDEQNEDITSDQLDGGAENKETSADQSDEEEQDEDPTDESDEGEPSGRSEEEQRNNDMSAEHLDDQEQDIEVSDDQSDDEEQDKEVTADRSDKETSAEQLENKELDGEESDEQSDDEEQDKEVTADRSLEETSAEQLENKDQEEEESVNQSDEEVSVEQFDNQEQNESYEEVTGDQRNEAIDNNISYPEAQDVREVTKDRADDETPKRTKQTSLETYLQKIKQDNAERKRKMEEEIRNSLKVPRRDNFDLFKVPQKPVKRIVKVQKPKVKQMKSLAVLPAEVREDIQYKPPKRFQPANASWITKRLYKFLETKLEPKYDYKARIRAEKLVECMYTLTKEIRRHDTPRVDGVNELKHEMAKLDLVKTHFDFYEFCHQFLPREIRVKVVPDVVNKIPLPKHGVFSDILR